MSTTHGRHFPPEASTVYNNAHRPSSTVFPNITITIPTKQQLWPIGSDAGLIILLLNKYFYNVVE